MRRFAALLTLSAAMALAVSGVAASQTPPASAPQDYLFPSGAGALIFHVRPDRT